MSKQLKFDATTGKTAIYNDTNGLAFTDPLNNLGDLFFHSDLNYLRVVEHQQINLTLPARDSGDNPWWEGGSAQTKYFYSEHQVYTATEPFLFAVARTGKSNINGNHYTDTGSSWRAVTLSWNGQTTNVLEQSRVTGSLPQKVLPIDIYFIDVSEPDINADNIKIDGGLGTVSLGQGKLSSENQYLRRSNTEEEDFFLFADPSIDMFESGLRYVDGDNSVIDINGYSGSWTGGLRYGVKV